MRTVRLLTRTGYLPDQRNRVPKSGVREIRGLDELLYEAAFSRTEVALALGVTPSAISHAAKRGIKSLKVLRDLLLTVEGNLQVRARFSNGWIPLRGGTSEGGDTLRSLREKTGLSVEELAARAGWEKRAVARFEDAQAAGKDLSIPMLARYLEALGGELDLRMDAGGGQLRWAATPESKELAGLPALAFIELRPLSSEAPVPPDVPPSALLPPGRRQVGSTERARAAALQSATTTVLDVLHFAQDHRYRLRWDAVFENARVPLDGGSGKSKIQPEDLRRQIGLEQADLDDALGMSRGSWRQLARRALQGEGIRVDTLKLMVAGLGGRLEPVASKPTHRVVLRVGELPTPWPLALPRK